jgi:hypothetical protein
LRWVVYKIRSRPELDEVGPYSYKPAVLADDGRHIAYSDGGIVYLLAVKESNELGAYEDAEGRTLNYVGRVRETDRVEYLLPELLKRLQSMTAMELITNFYDDHNAEFLLVSEDDVIRYTEEDDEAPKQ